jgi:hypothetical protein
MENQQQTQMDAPAVGGEAPAPAPELTITDLANLRSIIDVAVRRGAFGASEVSAVGAAFDRLNTFLNVVNPPKADTPPAQ